MEQKRKLYDWAITDVKSYDNALLSECYELFSGGSDDNLDWTRLESLRSLVVKIKAVLDREAGRSWLYKVVDGKNDTYFDCIRQILVTVSRKFFQIIRRELSIDEIVSVCRFFADEKIPEVLLGVKCTSEAYLENFISLYKNALSDRGVLDRSSLACCEDIRRKLSRSGQYQEVVELLDRSIEAKRNVVRSLKSHGFLDSYNPKVMVSARPPIDSIVDRVCFWGDAGVNLFQFVDVKDNFVTPTGSSERSCVVMDCFLSLESDVPFDLSIFRMFKLRPNEDYFFDGVGYQKISLLNGDTSNEQELQLQRKEMIRMVVEGNPGNLGIANACYTQTHGVETCGVVAHDLRTEAERTGNRFLALERALVPSRDGTVVEPSLGQYRLMLFKDCFDCSTGFVHSKVVNTDLGASGLGDKYLLLVEDAYAEENSQKVFIRWHVYASDTLLKRAMDKFIEDSLPVDGKPYYLDFRKGRFVCVSQDQYDSERISKKKPIVGRLAQSWVVLEKFLPREFKDILSALTIERDNPEADLDPEKIRQLEAMIVEAETRKEQERRAKAEAERKAKAEAEAKARAAAEQKAKEEAEAKRLAEEQRRMEEEQRLEQERIAKEEAEAKAKAEAEAKARDEEGVRGQDIINWVNKTHARSPMRKLRGKRNIDPNKVYKTSEGMTDIGCKAFEALMKK